jgi:hypothetical protein
MKVESAGLESFHAMEIFSRQRWSGDQAEFLEKIRAAYL